MSFRFARVILRCASIAGRCTKIGLLQRCRAAHVGRVPSTSFLACSLLYIQRPTFHSRRLPARLGNVSLLSAAFAAVFKQPRRLCLIFERGEATQLLRQVFCLPCGRHRHLKKQSGRQGVTGSHLTNSMSAIRFDKNVFQGKKKDFF